MLANAGFDATIEQQVQDIEQTGANYVAVDTPYDDQFLPYLRRWVNAARRHGLRVWFRGNFSGWEGWFDYPRIDRARHLQLTSRFILENADLFEDGDIFTACPECENGGPGDPRTTGDVAGFRDFLVAEYHATQAAFEKIGKRVASNFDSMNYDVARLTMDPRTTKALGGVVTIDHYVAEPSALAAGVDALAQSSGGHVVLGEFGAPIPDINGAMSEAEQASWLTQALDPLVRDGNLAGVNYWTGVGASTALWGDSGRPRQAVAVVGAFFRCRQSAACSLLGRNSALWRMA
jgi:hypothetical protein